MGDLSKHFSLSEFACKCGCKGEEAPAVKAALRDLCTRYLDPLRDAVGPLSVASGFRCKKHNARIGGARDSQHMRGTAADVISSTVPAISVQAQVVSLKKKGTMPGGGFGRYAGFTHIDSGPVRSWLG